MTDASSGGSSNPVGSSKPAAPRATPGTMPGTPPEPNRIPVPTPSNAASGWDDPRLEPLRSNANQLRQSAVGLGIALGAAIGAALGAALGDVGVWTAVGIGVGLAIGSGIAASQRNR